MADRATAIRNLIAAQPGRSHSIADYLQRVCQTAARTLAASGTGISVLTDDGVRGVCAASDARSERVEELQFVFGEGPCIDAFESRRPVLVPDLTVRLVVSARLMMGWRLAVVGVTPGLTGFMPLSGLVRLLLPAPARPETLA